MRRLRFSVGITTRARSSTPREQAEDRHVEPPYGRAQRERRVQRVEPPPRRGSCGLGSSDEPAELCRCVQARRSASAALGATVTGRPSAIAAETTGPMMLPARIGRTGAQGSARGPSHATRGKVRGAKAIAHHSWPRRGAREGWPGSTASTPWGGDTPRGQCRKRRLAGLRDIRRASGMPSPTPPA